MVNLIKALQPGLLVMFFFVTLWKQYCSLIAEMPSAYEDQVSQQFEWSSFMDKMRNKKELLQFFFIAAFHEV